MTTKYATPSERIAARQRAKEAKLATYQAKAATYYRMQADQRRNVRGEDDLCLEMDRKAEAAESWLRSANRCGRCGRSISAEESVATGYGPDCLQLVRA